MPLTLQGGPVLASGQHANKTRKQLAEQPRKDERQCRCDDIGKLEIEAVDYGFGFRLDEFDRLENDAVCFLVYGLPTGWAESKVASPVDCVKAKFARQPTGTTVTARRFCAQLAASDPSAIGRSLP